VNVTILVDASVSDMPGPPFSIQTSGDAGDTLDLDKKVRAAQLDDAA
jgi:hypothetical protein